MIKRLDHIAVRVKDLKKITDFYVETLGFQIICKKMDKNGNDRFVSLKTSDNSFLELFYFPETDTKTGHVISGYMHSCYIVDNIFELEQTLRNRGVVFFQEIRVANDGNYQFFITDPEGNQIEFIQLN